MEFENGVFTQKYDVKVGPGVVFPAKTTVIETVENLYIISPGPLKDRLEAISNVQKRIHFIAPNNFHHFFLPKMKEVFPEAKFYGNKRVERISKIDLHPIVELNELEFQKILGNELLGEYVFFHNDSKSLIVTDLIFNFRHKMNLPTKLTTFLAGTNKGLAISRVLKMTTDDRFLMRKSIEKLLQFPFEKVIINHGEDITRADFEQIVDKLEKYL